MGIKEKLPDIRKDIVCDSVEIIASLKEINIPYVQTIISVIESGCSIKDNRQAANLNKFIDGIRDIDYEEDQEYYDKTIKGKEVKFGKLTLDVAEQMEAEEKVLLLARLHKYCARNKCGTDVYLKVGTGIMNGFHEDFPDIKIIEENESVCEYNDCVDSTVVDSLYRLGFLQNAGYDGGGFCGEPEGNIYELNKYGKILAQII